MARKTKKIELFDGKYIVIPEKVNAKEFMEYSRLEGEVEKTELSFIELITKSYFIILEWNYKNDDLGLDGNDVAEITEDNLVLLGLDEFSVLNTAIPLLFSNAFDKKKVEENSYIKRLQDEMKTKQKEMKKSKNEKN